MFECERLFGIAEGLKVQELIEARTGSPCPCKRNEPCLMLPTEVVVPEAV